MAVPVQAWAVVLLPAWPVVVTVPDCEALCVEERDRGCMFADY